MFSEQPSPFDPSAITEAALSAIRLIETEYYTSCHAFTFPSQLDFVFQDTIVSISVPAALLDCEVTLNDSPVYPATRNLGYTKNNAPLHLYADTLGRLLVALDRVEMGRLDEVCNVRRSLIQKINNEGKLLEQRVSGVWDTRNNTMIGFEQVLTLFCS